MHLFSKSMMPVPSKVSKPNTFFSMTDTLSSAMPATEIIRDRKASTCELIKIKMHYGATMNSTVTEFDEQSRKQTKTIHGK